MDTRAARPFSFSFNTSDYRVLLMDQDQVPGQPGVPGGPGHAQCQQGATHSEWTYTSWALFKSSLLFGMWH